MTFLQHLTSIILLWNDWKLKNFGKIQTFLGLKRQKIVRMHKTCLTSQFLRLSLVRFSREMAYLPSTLPIDTFPENIVKTIHTTEYFHRTFHCLVSHLHQKLYKNRYVFKFRFHYRITEIWADYFYARMRFKKFWKAIMTGHDVIICV